MSSSIEEIVYHELSTAVLVAAQVSSRITPEYRPNEFTLPCLVYSVNSLAAMQSLNGRCQTFSGEVTVSCLSNTVESANDAGNAVRVALDSTHGTLNGTSYSFRLSDVDADYEPPIDGGDDGFGVYSKNLTFTFFKDSEDI